MSHWFKTATVKWPLGTQAAISCLLFATGDVIAQKVAQQRAEDKDKAAQLSWSRVAQFSSFGLFVYGPTLHHWFRFMERLFPGNTMKTAAKKVLVHTSCYGTFSVASLLGYVAVTDGKPEEAWPRVKSRTIPVWASGGAFWVPYMLGNYALVPLHYRVLSTNVANIGWTTYLSWKATAPLREDELSHS